MDEEKGFVRIRLNYVGIDDAPLFYANQFAVQHQRDEFVLSVGRVFPPLLLGTQEERLEQAQRISEISVQTVARIVMNRENLVQLIAALQDNLAKHDERMEHGTNDDDFDLSNSD